MPAHVACRPSPRRDDPGAGCWVVCPEHGLRTSFGFAHEVARAARAEHNAIHHPDSLVRRPRLLAIVYESRATHGLDADALPALLAQARFRNRAYGVTGMLLTEDGWFLQALEGPEPIVDDLMRSIARDPRHEHVRVLARELRQQRRFPDWAMAQGHIGEVEALPLAQYYEGLLNARGAATAAEV